MKLPKGLNIIFLFLFIYSAHSQQPQHQQSHQQRNHARKLQQLARTKRIYAMCPPSFTKIGNECYYLSSSKASWLDSHFECKDKNSKLAEPLKYADRLLRKYFMERGRTRGEIWIGGMYNWQRMKWQWGYNGKDMTYQSFSQMRPGGSEDLKYNCAVLNPDLKNSWSARSCSEEHFYLCQHRIPFESKSRIRRGVGSASLGTSGKVLLSVAGSKATSAVGDEIINRNDLTNLSPTNLNAVGKTVQIGSAFTGCAGGLAGGFAAGTAVSALGNFVGAVTGLVVGCAAGAYLGQTVGGAISHEMEKKTS